MGNEHDFQKHFGKSLIDIHDYKKYQNEDITDREYYLVEPDFIDYIKRTQIEKFKKLEESYGTDTPTEIVRALKDELCSRPLWVIFRHGLTVRDVEFQLFDRIPRSSDSSEDPANNTIAFLPELVIDEKKRPDFIIYLNGLPIIVIELKHEKNQNVYDAVEQFAKRNHDDKIFRLPFLYIASDTSEVKVATNPQKEEYFRWYNAGLVNKPFNKGEYPVEYLYRHVLSRNSILEAISFYLIYVPKVEATESTHEKPAFAIFPRYHQSRMVDALTKDLREHCVEKGICGKKYLINHSAGSGKTLSISWLADRLNSLYLPDTNKKIIDIVFILTDRKVLDKNVKDELVNFSHLQYKMKFARKSGDLPKFIKQRQQIIVTTQQKITWIIEELQKEPSLKELNIAFLIDEAHRSQEGKSATRIRNLFKKADEPDDADTQPDEEEELNKEIKKADLPNLTIVAFTATPGKSTVQLFGEPFDIYSEAEAIQEGYIVDVASSIISYKTLYNLKSKVAYLENEKVFPPGVISKMLRNIAYQDKGLIQYKAELMLRMFEEDVRHLIDDKAKAMIVTSSRIAGLYYYEILKEKLREKRAADPERYNYDVLFAFSSFIHPETDKEITEEMENGLATNQLIEDLFDTDKYRLLVVANKFQTGFDQPLLAGMFLDKIVSDKNAVQTLSRLNRCHDSKDRVVVVDFTNNADQIIKAFKKYRKGTPYEPTEPDINKLEPLYQEILSWNIFNQQTAEETVQIIESKNDADMESQASTSRTLFQSKVQNTEEANEYINLLKKFNGTEVFLSNFFEIPDKLERFSMFCEFIAPQLLKQGTESDLKKILKSIYVSKTGVSFVGEKTLTGEYGKKSKPGNGSGPDHIAKVTVSDVIKSIKEKYQISEEEAIVIQEVCDEKIKDSGIHTVIENNRNDESYLFENYQKELRNSIESSYMNRSLFDCLVDEKYIDPGSIFDIMSHTVIKVTIDECA